MPVKQEDLDKALEVKAIIEKEYHKSFLVADLAQMVGTNKSTLNIAFKAITSQPVKKYIRDFRTEKARHLLETSNMSVEIIACRVGLHRTNLEKNFKKCYGKSPKDWRKNQVQFISYKMNATAPVAELH
jgi:transcriptional regulator GlxA family with amidase domain